MRQLLFSALKIAVSAALLILVAYHVDERQVVSRLTNAHPYWLGAALGTLIVQLIMGAFRWRYVIETLSGRHFSIAGLSGLSGTASLFGQVLPSTVGGDLFRIGAIGKSVGLAAALRSVLVDRALGLAALGMLTLSGAGFLAFSEDSMSMLLLPFAVGAAACSGLGLLLIAARRLERPPRMLLPLAVLASDINLCLGRRDTAMALILSILIHVFSAIALFFIALGIRLEPPALWQFLAIIPGILLLSAIPVSLGGWGVREGAMVAGLAMLGIDRGAAFTLSVLFGVALVVVGMSGCLVWAVIKMQEGNADKCGRR